jgi:hypothetical protein
MKTADLAVLLRVPATSITAPQRVQLLDWLRCLRAEQSRLRVAERGSRRLARPRAKMNK